MSSWRAAVVSGLASALAACAVLLAAGAFDDERSDVRPAPLPATATTASPGDVYRRARLGVVLVEHRPPGVRPRRGRAAARRRDRHRHGRVIGVISQGRASGIAFAVPVDTVKRVVADLRRRGRARSGSR